MHPTCRWASLKLDYDWLQIPTIGYYRNTCSGPADYLGGITNVPVQLNTYPQFIGDGEAGGGRAPGQRCPHPAP